MVSTIMATQWQAKLDVIRGQRLTWEQIAERVGVSRSTLHRIHNGDTDDPERSTRVAIEALYQQARAGKLKQKK